MFINNKTPLLPFLLPLHSSLFEWTQNLLFWPSEPGRNRSVPPDASVVEAQAGTWPGNPVTPEQKQSLRD